MKLYHGSNTEIHEIDLRQCKPYKDFGRGFYCTTIFAQAAAMAKRVVRIYGGTPVVTEYDFDKPLAVGALKVLCFQRPSEDWARFIMNNRSREFKDYGSAACNHDLKYDIVIGPIANDDLTLLFRAFENGLLSMERLAKGMEYKQLTDQYSFHTEAAIRFLVKAGAHNV